MEDSRSVGATVAELLNEVSTLVRTEANTARAELSENFSSFTGGVRILVLAAAFLIPGVVLLLHAIAAAATAGGLPNYWSLAIFSGGAFIVGTVLAFIGRDRVGVSTLAPRKTLGNLNRELVTAKVSSQPAE